MNTNITIKDIAWLAGLLEGEGSFGSGSQGCPALRLQMTDKDVVEYASSILRTKLQNPTRPQNPKWKPCYSTSATGRHGIEWMMTIYAFMGMRRRKQIEDVIRSWRQSGKSQRSSHNGNKITSNCHPDRAAIHGGSLLCKQCYMKEWYKTDIGIESVGVSKLKRKLKRAIFKKIKGGTYNG